MITPRKEESTDEYVGRLQDNIIKLEGEYKSTAIAEKMLIAEVVKLRKENEDLRSEMAWVYGLKEGVKYLGECYVKEIRKTMSVTSRLDAIIGDESGAMPQSTLEAVADVSHQIWAHWMGYLFSVCELSTNGSVYIPVESVARWKKQVVTDYADLPEKSKDSDREQAEKILTVIREIG